MGLPHCSGSGGGTSSNDSVTSVCRLIASVCDPVTGLDSQRGNGFSAGMFFTIRRDGESCYTARWGGKAPFSGALYNRDGEMALVDPDWAWSVCGLGGTEQAVMLHPDDPACAPWFDRLILTRACSVGTCPPP